MLLKSRRKSVPESDVFLVTECDPPHLVSTTKSEQSWRENEDSFLVPPIPADPLGKTNKMSSISRQTMLLYQPHLRRYNRCLQTNGDLELPSKNRPQS